MAAAAGCDWFGCTATDSSASCRCGRSKYQLTLAFRRRNAEILDVSKALIDSGATDFDGLHLLYTPGAAVQDSGLVTGLSGQTMGLLVRGCFYMEGKTLFGQIKRRCPMIDVFPCLAWSEGYED